MRALAILASLAVAGAAQAAPACLKPGGVLVVFAGQSNATGYLMSPATLPMALAAPDPLTCIWSPGGWTVMRAGLNTGGPNTPRAWGGEVSFARAFRRDHPGRPLLIVKSTKGGTGLAADPAQLDWSPGSRDELFDTATQAIAAARAALPRPLPVAAVFWMQGEEDAVSPLKAPLYAANLAGWLPAVRARWIGDPKGYVAVGLITRTLPFSRAIRTAQTRLAAANTGVATVEAGDLPLAPDRVHFTAQAHVALGQRFYRAFSASRR